MTLKAIFALTIMLPALVFAQAGVPEDGLPDYHERALYTIINASRMSPAEFGDRYITSGGNPLSSYPRVAPIVMHHDLNRAARYHADDMMACGKLSHNSCDGTSARDRVRSFYGSYSAECVAVGQRTPMSVMVDAWLLSDRGHRDAIMNGSYLMIGCGHAGTKTHWWVLDFATRGSRPENPVYGASHLLLSGNSTTFWLNYYAGSQQMPQRVDAIVAGTRVPLEKLFHDRPEGTYGASVPRSSTCRQYWFELTDTEGTTWRYPEQGAFVTFGEGDCENNYSDKAEVFSFLPHRQPQRGMGSARILRSGNRLLLDGVDFTHIRAAQLLLPSGRLLCTFSPHSGTALSPALPARGIAYLRLLDGRMNGKTAPVILGRGR
jgi:hypothetical protein